MDPLVPTPSILYWTVALNVLRNDESFVSSKQFYKQVFESQGSFNKLHRILSPWSLESDSVKVSRVHWEPGSLQEAQQDSPPHSAAHH